MRKLLLGICCAWALAGCGPGMEDACDPSFCTGCCDAKGVCQSGALADACGAGGNLCSACAPGLECSRGVCQWPATSPPGDGGSADGGSVGSDGGLTQDGGLSTDGGCAPYAETPPNPNANIAQLTYSPGNERAYILEVLGQRYPLGKHLVMSAPTSSIDCVQAFATTSSKSALLRSISTVVHECGHILDAFSPGGDVYVIREDLTFNCTQGDTTSRGGKTFARSLITKDAYVSLRPPCNGVSTAGCDFYADVYLDGDPTDGKFDSGDQGYNLLLEEAAQYVNSLATGYALADQYGGSSVSERDGILTFMWYLERYLLMARTQYPTAYQFLLQDSCWRNATATVWQRTEFYLELTKNNSKLGISDQAITPLVRDPALLAELGPFLQCTP